MIKQYFFVIFSFLLAAVCLVAYNIIGSEVALDGTLIEPFGFIPLGYLFFLIGIVAIVIISIKLAKKKK